MLEFDSKIEKRHLIVCIRGSETCILEAHVNLPLFVVPQSNRTIEACLDSFLEVESLDGDNQVFMLFWNSAVSYAQHVQHVQATSM